jgi:hypothetical protein
VARRGHGRSGRHLLGQSALAWIALVVGVACTGTSQPTPEPARTTDPRIERHVGIYSAAIREVLDVPGTETERTVGLVEAADPNGPVARKPGPKLTEDVVDGLVGELDELKLRPVSTFRDAVEGGRPRGGGVLVTVSPIRDRTGPAAVSASVFAGSWNAHGSQLVVGLRNRQWRVIRELGAWIT